MMELDVNRENATFVKLSRCVSVRFVPHRHLTNVKKAKNTPQNSEALTIIITITIISAQMLTTG